MSGKRFKKVKVDAQGKNSKNPDYRRYKVKNIS